jgi:hypothetical protein
VDRISVRSFRAVDLAERAIRDLARSRIDTTREAVFQPLSARFLEARSDAIRIAALFREDAFRTPSGYFSRLDLRPDAALAERLPVLEPGAVEARIEQATRAALARELPRADGVFLVRFEPSSREGLAPVAHVHLTSRLTDSGPAPAISRDHAARFEERWSREMERAFGVRDFLALARERDDRGPVLNPEGERLRQEWARASARLFAVYASRLAGKASREELTQAAAQARTARSGWSAQFGRAVDLREMDSRRTLDVVQVRIEGGAKYLSGPLEAHRKTVLEAAATRAAGLPEGPERHLAVVVWPAGRDLHAAVYFNQRSRPERLPGHIEPERLRGLLEQRLRREIVQLVPTIDAQAGLRERDLGSVHVRLPQAEPRLAARAERAHDEAIPVRRAMVVELARNAPISPSTLESGAPDTQTRSSEHRENEERDWSNERVFAVRVRIPTGAEQIDRYDLGPQETGRAIQRAIDRAYPFLAREGLRNNFLYTEHGRALDIRVLVPQKLGWTPEQLRSPQFQQRLVTGFHQAVSQLGTTQTAVERHPAIAAAERSIGLVRQAPQLLRQAEQDPERAARTLARAAFNKLSEALPKPFRMMREVGRALSRFARNE